MDKVTRLLISATTYTGQWIRHTGGIDSPRNSNEETIPLTAVRRTKVTNEELLNELVNTNSPSKSSWP